MKNHISIRILFLFLLISCSDSKNPVAPDDPADEDNMVVVEGDIYGPGPVSGKSWAIEDVNSAALHKELQGHASPSDTARTKRDRVPSIVSESLPAAKGSTPSGEVPWGDVPVSLYELTDYLSSQGDAELLATTTTDPEGRYSVSGQEEGADLVIVTESTSRLTLIVMDVDEESTGDINSATSIVSEYWAAEIMADRTFDQANFEEMLKTADGLIEEMSVDELQNVLEELVPAQFGDGFSDSLSQQANHFVNLLLDRNTASCTDIVFSQSSARPGSFITVRNLPDDLGDDPFGWGYVADDANSVHPVYIGMLPGNEGELFVPLHPVTPLDGGDIQVFFESEDGNVTCEDFTIEIEPLDPAPGTFETMVNELEDKAVSVAEKIGYSKEELLSADMDHLESYAAVLKAVLTVTGEPEYPGNIRAAIENDTSQETLELYDAVLAEVLFSDVAGKQVFSGNTDTPFLPDMMSCNVPLNGLSGGFAIPEDLDCWMNVSDTFEEFNQSYFQPYHDFQSRAYSLMSNYPGKQVQEIANTGETYLAFMKMMLESFEFLYPGELLGIDLEANPQVYSNEDDDTAGEWEASIVAGAKDWEFDALLALEVLPIGAGTGGAMLSKLMRQSDQVGTIIESTLDRIQGELQGTGIGVYTFEAQAFGPIEILPQRDEDYFTWQLNTKSQETNMDPFSFTQDEQGYTPEAVGTADLRVETKGGDVFKGQNVFNMRKLEVEQMEVTTGQWIGDNIFTENESPYYIEVQEELSLYADVSNAINTDVIWSVSPAESGLSVVEYPGRDNVVEVLATEPGRYTIEAESIADTGPRADSTPRRFDQVRIIVGDLTVTNPGCMKPGESYQLIARIGAEQIDFSELEWDLSGPGSINSDGVYTAGGTGSADIHFQVKAQPEITDTIHFSVKEMCSSFSLTSAEFNIEGECVVFSENDVSGNTGFSFDNAKLPNGGLTIMELLSEAMSPDEAWSATGAETGWRWTSKINNYTEISSDIGFNTYTFDTNEHDGGNFSLSQEIIEVNNSDTRVLSGSFSAIFHWIEPGATEGSIVEKSTPGMIEFTGALPGSVNNCWATGNP